MSESPLDQLNVNLPGRLMVVELLLLQLLKRHSKAGQFFKGVDQQLAEAESGMIGEGFGSQYVLEVSAAARESLDWFIREYRRE